MTKSCDYNAVVKLAREYGFSFTNAYKSEILVRAVARGPLAGKTLAISDDDDTMSLPCDTDSSPVTMAIYKTSDEDLGEQEDWNTYPTLRAALVVADALVRGR